MNVFFIFIIIKLYYEKMLNFLSFFGAKRFVAGARISKNVLFLLLVFILLRSVHYYLVVKDSANSPTKYPINDPETLTGTPVDPPPTASNNVPLAIYAFFWNLCRTSGISFLILEEDWVRVFVATNGFDGFDPPVLTHLSILQGDAVKLIHLLQSPFVDSDVFSALDARVARQDEKSGAVETVSIAKASMQSFLSTTPDFHGFVIFPRFADRVEISILIKTSIIKNVDGGYFYLPWSPRGRPLALPDLSVKRIVVPGIEGTFYVPADVDRFLWEMEAAEFVACDPKRIPDFRVKSGKELVKEKAVVAAGNLKLIVELRNEMAKRRKRNFLFGRTLLGWYAQCSLIQYDVDVHTAQWIDDYEESMPVYFFGHALLKLLAYFGLKDDGLEFKLGFGTRNALRLHWLYRKDDESWIGLHSSDGLGEKKIASYPAVRRICSADLYGRLVNVPCDAWSLLRAEYGDLPWTAENPAYHETRDAKNVRIARLTEKKELSPSSATLNFGTE